MTHDEVNDWTFAGRMIAYRVTCPFCDEIFYVNATDKAKVTVCCYCSRRLPLDELEGRAVQ